MYELALKKSARKELDSLPYSEFSRVDKAISALKENPHPFPQSKKLKGEDSYRLRCGNYRVVYTIDESLKVITICRVRHRKEVYG